MELLDVAARNLYDILMSHPPSVTNVRFDEFYSMTFSQSGFCSLDYSVIADILRHDWLEASVLAIFCM